MADRFDDGIAHLLDVLSRAIRATRTTRQSVERQMGLSSGYLSKILGGAVELRVRHVLMLAAALNMEPDDLFRLAWPGRDLALASEETRRLIETLQAELGLTPAPAKPEPDHEFDERVKRSLARLLGLDPAALTPT